MRMLNQKTYKYLIRGLEQQLWFFGQDTSNPENNRFEKYGFCRYRTPGHGGSNRYRIRFGFRTVELHSYCVGIYGNDKDGFLYVRSHNNAYAYLSQKPPIPGRYRKAFLTLPSDVKSKKRFYQASCNFLNWLEKYETWLDVVYGKNYRRDCYERYHRKWLAPDQAREWFWQYRQLQSDAQVLQVVQT